MSDSVEHPSHYNAGGIETIEGIKAALGDAFLDYCRGNVLKYVWRCKHKGKLLEDLRKASKYLEWAIEAAESNCPETPDSSRAMPIPIPHGWRELEPDEVPLATDMHEWMGGWFFRKDDATHEYKWHSSRHVRKIETANTSETPNSSKWIPKGGDRVRVVGNNPKLCGDCAVVYEVDSDGLVARVVSYDGRREGWLPFKDLELTEASS